MQFKSWALTSSYGRIDCLQNGSVYLEEIFQKAAGTSPLAEMGKNPTMVAAGKKACTDSCARWLDFRAAHRIEA